MEVRIWEMEVWNFKGMEHLRLEFLGQSGAVYGDNGTGKTTVADALCWLLFGKDSQGGAGMEVRPLGKDGELKDPLAITEVRAVLLVDGVRRELRRCYHGVWSRKNGENVFVGNTSEYYVDGVPCRKQGYQQKVGQVFREETFRLLTGIHCFAGELNWQRRREILYELCQVSSDRALIFSQPQFEDLGQALGDLSLEDLGKKLNLQKKELKKAKSDIPPRISELERQLFRREVPDFQALRQQRQVIGDRYQALLREDPDRAAESELREKKLDLKDLQRRREAEQAELDRLEQQRQRKIRQLREDLTRLAAELQGGREEKLRSLLAENQAEAFAGDHCPTCGQKLEGPAREAAEAAFLKEKEERSRALETQLLECRERREKKQQEAEAFSRELETLEKQPGSRKTEVSPEEAALEQEIRQLQLGLQQSGWGEKKLALLKELEDLDRALAQESWREDLRRRLQQLRREEQAAAEKLEKTEGLLLQLEAFTRFKVRFLEDTVNSQFRLAKFRLFRNLASGGLEERCDVLLEGVPYSNLNTGARVHVGMDILRTLSRHYGLQLPLFVDNAESVTKLDGGQGQVIRLVVSPGDPVLRLAREEGGR